MIDKFSTNIVSLQFALFFRDVIERPDLEFHDINANLMNIFDAIPSITNIPRELPTDIPIVTQRSESNEYICNISRARIDLHFNKVNGEKSNAELLSDFNAKVNGLLAYVLKKRDLIRFGMICRYFHQADDATATIKNKYFKNNIGDIAELSLRYNKKETTLGWEINDMVEITAVEAVMKDWKSTGILIQRDINNSVIHDKTLSLSNLMEISKHYSDRITEKNIEELIK